MTTRVLTCPGCGSNTRRHCPSEANIQCDWSRCDDCQIEIDPKSRTMPAPKKG